MNVVFFHRKPVAGNFSVELAFQIIREAMPARIECIVFQSRFRSKGILKRLYNIIEAFFQQKGDVNHITGDVHFLSYLLTPQKTLLTILDCVFMYNAKGLKKQLLRLFWYIIPAKRVALISVISQATKDELLKCIKCDPDKIRVVPVCISPGFVFVEKKFNLDKPVILQVGTGSNKNIIRLAEALQGINCRLDIVGILSMQQMLALNRFEIEYSNSYNLTQEELRQKYHECDIVTFVSTYEGFGMPILEANAVGRPVITSNIFSMPEVAGNAACIVAPYDVLEIKDGIIRVINDECYRNSLIANGLKNVLRFEPRIVAQQYLQLYEEILRTRTIS